MLRCWGLLAMAALLACSGEPKAVGPRAGGLATPTGLAAVLPADGEVHGWTRSGEVESFGAGNLWEYMNGAAESYLEFGFQEMVTAEYKGGGAGESFVVEIYRMVDAVHAFGIYRYELPAEPSRVPVGVEGHTVEGSLRFWASAYYVKVTVFGTSAELEHGVQELTGLVAQRMGDHGSLPPQVAFFPPEGQIAASLRFVPADVLSQRSLRHGFEAEYSVAGDLGKLVIVELSDDATAAEAVGELEDFVASSGEPVAAIGDLADGGFSGRHAFYGGVVAVRAGSRMMVAAGFASPAAARQVLSACLERIGGGAPALSLEGE